MKKLGPEKEVRIMEVRLYTVYEKTTIRKYSEQSIPGKRVYHDIYFQTVRGHKRKIEKRMTYSGR